MEAERAWIDWEPIETVKDEDSDGERIIQGSTPDLFLCSDSTVLVTVETPSGKKRYVTTDEWNDEEGFFENFEIREEGLQEKGYHVIVAWAYMPEVFYED